MLRFTLNGTQIEIEDGENRTLLEYLRNVKCMKGTKEACSIGHCGACSVLVDGRLTRSCVMLVRRLDGKAVETIENAPNDTMLQVIQHSFLDVGAVQCGFCTPGMVMATKALLLHHPAPTEPEICDGLKNNYCRCTGYVKIIEAVKLAAARLRGEDPDIDSFRSHESTVIVVGENQVVPEITGSAVGKSVWDVDGMDKTGGKLKFCDDLTAEDIGADTLLHGAFVWAPAPHAKINAVDYAAAEQAEGVVRIVTAADVPGMNKMGTLTPEQPVFCSDEVIFLVDHLALVVADTVEHARAAAKLVRIDYEELPGIYTMADGYRKNSFIVHTGRKSGDVEQAKQRPDIVKINVSKEIEPQEHACMEPVSAIGMVFAVAMAFIVLFAGEASNGFKHGVAVIVLIVGIVIGAVAGVVSAKKVKMTDMPQLVSVFNTVGGGAAALVALNDILTSEGTPSVVVLITAGLGIMIGSVTLSGSLIAAGKLQGIKWVKKLSLPGKGFWNILFVVLTIVSFVMLCVQPNQRLLWSILTTVFALCYGLVFVIPIGGADMPVVISVLNACTGTAVAMSGLAINNIALIVAGALVGAAGVTLSIAMSKAMNRPLLSVLAGGFGGANAAAGAGEGPEGTMKETSADDLAVQLVYAEKVIFVPGFGLAQAQAQRELADLGVLLKDHGVEVSYAIHPVAGRMPGHMNVLLAEANVPYEELVDLDDINPQFPQANVALVVGANDVTNPAARKPGTPVSGMPILDVDKSQNVVGMKRGRGTGYAGIQNELYFEDNTQMLFGDAKASLQAVIAAVKELIN